MKRPRRNGISPPPEVSGHTDLAARTAPRRGAAAVCAGVMLVAGFMSCRPRQPAEPAPAAVSGAASATGQTAPGQAQTSDAPAPADLVLDDAVLATFFDDDIPRSSGGYTYSYGGKTSNKVLPSSTAGNKAVFATFFDNDYSGVNISLGNAKFVDLAPYRKPAASPSGSRLAPRPTSSWSASWTTRA